MTALISRRVLLTGIGALTLASCNTAGTTGEPTGAQFSSVSVDVAPLRQQGIGPWADIIAAAAQSEAKRVFAGRISPKAPKLVIQFTSLAMGDYVGGGAGTAFSGEGDDATNDYLEGKALFVGPKGDIVRTFPQMNVLPSNNAGPWYGKDIEQQRLISLTQNYVQWLGRRL